MSIGHLYNFFGKISIFLAYFYIGLLFFLLLLSCMSYFYILEIKPLSVISFANIFSPSVACLSLLLMLSFAMQKLLSLIKSHLFLLLFPLPKETDP